LFDLARMLKLPASEFAEALQKHQLRQKIKSDFSGGVRNGVNGTPTSFVNAQRFDGSHHFDSPVKAIEDADPAL